MSIWVRCECGKEFPARDDRAGKKARCPACAASIIVPGEADEGKPVEPVKPRTVGDASVWTAPQTGAPGFIVLTNDTLYLAPWLRTGSVEKAIERLEGGGSPANLFGLGDAIIPLNSITFVQIHLTLCQATVTYVVNETDGRSAVASFSGEDVLAGFYLALRGALGPGWVEENVQQNRWQATWQPLLATLVSGGIVAGLICNAVFGGGLLGWVGGCFIAFLVVVFACSLTWFIQHLREPPLLTNLSRGG
jgi:DNA-directed RNA polymerase subunit RPC12/RpoP